MPERLSIASIRARIAEAQDEPGDEMKGFFAYDIFRECERGTDRGLMGIAIQVIESMLRHLLLADPHPPSPEERALIAPGGPLDGRAALLTHLTSNHFIGQRTATAIAVLFACERKYFDYGNLAVFDTETIKDIEPFLRFKEDPHASEPDRTFTMDSFREDFEIGCREVANILLTHIGNHQRGQE